MKKILVVDDSSVQRKMIIQIIRKAGYEHEVLQAGDGLQAIAMLGEHFKEVGVVLCDWYMPNMNGLQFVEAMARVPEVAAIPVVMVTTESAADKIKLVMDANPRLQGYVSKPFTPEQLREVVEPILAKV